MDPLWSQNFLSNLHRAINLHQDNCLIINISQSHYSQIINNKCLSTLRTDKVFNIKLIQANTNPEFINTNRFTDNRVNNMELCRLREADLDLLDLLLKVSMDKLLKAVRGLTTKIKVEANSNLLAHHLVLNLLTLRT